MNNIFKIPAFQRRKAIPKQLKDLELLPLNEQFSKLTISIVGDDDLRPVMMGNFFDMEKKKIVSTDAHKLTAINMPNRTFDFIKQTYNKELDKEQNGLIFHTLSQLQKDYNKLMKNNNISISFDEFVKDRAIEDGRYPNYEAVIPKEFTNEINVDYQKLYWYAKVLVDAKVIDDVTKINTSNANEYQNKKIEYLKDSYTSFLNPVTKQIILTYTLDGKQEYIGFNARLLCDLLKFAMEFNGKTFGKVGLSGNSRAMVIELENGLNVINDSVGIVMPIMLVSGEFDNTIGDIDFDLSVAMYYDLDTNSIISDKENYPINESIGFIPNKAGLSTPKIRVKEEVSKVENSSADLIDKKIRGLIIALKVAKAENKANIEKKIKGLEIAKRMKKDDLPFKNGGNVDEDISWDITIRDVYDNETFEINVRGYFENEEDAIKQAIKDYNIYVEESGKMYWNGNEIIIYGAKKNYKKGGSIGFKGLSNKVASNYEGKKVPQRFQSIYGKTYSQSEAQEVGNKVAGKVYREQQANKMAKGGMVEFYDYKGVEIMYEPTYEEYFANDLVFNTLEKAKKYIDSGEANETPIYIENLYRRGAMAKGGGVDKKLSYEEFVETLRDNDKINTYTGKTTTGMEMFYLPNSHSSLGKKFTHKNKQKAYKEYLSTLIMANGGSVDDSKIWEILYLDKGVQKSILVKGYSSIIETNNWKKQNPNKEFIQIRLYGDRVNDYENGGEVGEYAKGGGVSSWNTLTIEKIGKNFPYKLNDLNKILQNAVGKRNAKIYDFSLDRQSNKYDTFAQFVYSASIILNDAGSDSVTPSGTYFSKKSLPIMFYLRLTIDKDGNNNPITINASKDVAGGMSIYKSIQVNSLYEIEKYINSILRDNPTNNLENMVYKDGGAVDGVYIDLFEDYENIPAEVQMILDEYSESFEDGDYIGMSKAQNELEQIGYTFDFYVDGDAYGLRPMNVKLSQLQGYEDEDEE